MSAHLVVVLVSWSVVKDVGALFTIRAGTPLMVKRIFPRVISTAINAAIIAIYHRTQHRPEPWTDYLVIFPRQTQ